jgi:hypothetical protein
MMADMVKKKAKKERAKEALSRVKKEMAEPRTANSARRNTSNADPGRL